MCVEYLADIRRFMSLLGSPDKELVTFRPLALGPVEISELLEKLQGIYDCPNMVQNTDTVLIGSNVKIINMLDYSEMIMRITLPNESDPAMGKITVLSPLGSKLLGRHKGETVNVFTGNRMNRFRIISID